MTSTAMIVTDDPAIADGLLRLAAAADAEAEVARSADEARAGWQGPGLILVGIDLARDLAATGLQRRPGVVLVSRGGDTTDVYRLAMEIGAQDLAVLPTDEAWLIDGFAASTEPADGWGTMLCVVGARGGAGASVLSAALALAASRAGARTLLIDADPFGGGLDLMLGLEEHEGVRWPDLAERRGRLSTSTLRESLPRLGDLSMLSWRRGEPVPLSQEAVLSLLDAAVRGFDLVVVDVPRHLEETGRSALRAADLTFLVVPAEVRATVAADGLSAALRRETTDLRLVVRCPSPGGLAPDMITQALGLPLAGVFESDRKIPAAVEEGNLARATHRGPLTDLCHRLVADLVPQEYELDEAA
ncbi:MULTISPECIES: septum site-determining protein Ssd [Thermomonosporaceae]|uniref:septum site-determining protein Ssd n=1 Tax=Thermomonosporaceae TaxID=2012 RepID=UPI00255B0A01|nr:MULTISPECIES: septum site-determining protein Ssd [Thermomonosporaceae]MDL4773354.1 CpaE-like family protein [Actinomadura xylanilytica]